MVLASRSVLSMREWRSRRLYPGVHRRSPIPAPPRCTTVSTSASTAGSRRPRDGSQRRSWPAAGSLRTRWTTSWPPSRSDDDSAPPIRPEEPAMATRCRVVGMSGLEVALLEAGLDRAEEAGGVGADDDPVVVGHREVHHRPDGQGLAPALGVDHDRAAHDGAGAENPDLRLVQ